MGQTGRVLHDTFWIGVSSGLPQEMLDFSAAKLEEFFGVGF